MWQGRIDTARIKELEIKKTKKQSPNWADIKDQHPDGQQIPIIDLNKLKDIQKAQAEGTLNMDMSSELGEDSIYKDMMREEQVELSADSEEDEENEGEHESVDVQESQASADLQKYQQMRQKA